MYSSAGAYPGTTADRCFEESSRTSAVVHSAVWYVVAEHCSLGKQRSVDGWKEPRGRDQGQVATGHIDEIQASLR